MPGGASALPSARYPLQPCPTSCAGFRASSSYCSLINYISMKSLNSWLVRKTKNTDSDVPPASSQSSEVSSIPSTSGLCQETKRKAQDDLYATVSTQSQRHGGEPGPSLLLSTEKTLKPHQPATSNFPVRKFGKQGRSFCSSWLNDYPWIHYLESTDSVICFYCNKAAASKRMLSKYSDEAFVNSGFSNWKKARERFEKHQKCISHREATEIFYDASRNVGDLLNVEYSKEKHENSHILMKIFQALRFLSRQGLSMRGHETGEKAESAEVNSNFYQLLKFLAESDKNLAHWLKKKQNKFTSASIQNEVLDIMSYKVLSTIVEETSSKWFAVMADETPDASNKEQLVICLRYFLDNFECREEFLGLYNIPSTNAETIYSVIKDVLLRFNLNLSNCRGQCYDGAATMSGSLTGVATRIKKEEPRAIYTHCYGHALSLSCQDAIKNNPLLRDTLETVLEITKLIKRSPKREGLFQKVKLDSLVASPGVRVLCPTRWTVRADALDAISQNYSSLYTTWELAKESTTDPEIRSRIGGVVAQMENFRFIFGVELGKTVLNMADNLSRTLQSPNISAAEGQSVMKMTLKTMESIRSEERFNLFWELLEKKRTDVDFVEEPRLPRKRKAPKRFEEGHADPYSPKSSKEYYRGIYFQVLDYTISSIRNRFDQEGYKDLLKMESLLLKKSVSRQNVQEFVEPLYSVDINADRLTSQLELLHTNLPASEYSVSSIKEYLISLGLCYKEIFSEVVKLLKLILLVPATNAASERNFSALRRVKSYLRTTMTQQRLNSCMVLHVHKERTDNLSISDIAKEFVSRCSSRKAMFGDFK